MDNEKMLAATKYDLTELDKRLTSDIKENRSYIDAHSKEIAKLEAVYRSLEGLPNTIANLDKTITVISHNLGSMNDNLSEVRQSVANQEHAIKEIRGENKTQNEHISRIDNKSKIDWANFVTKNFWKILCIFGIGYVIIKGILEGGV